MRWRTQYEGETNESGACMHVYVRVLRDPATKVVTAYNLNPNPTLDPSVGTNDNDPQIAR